MKILKNIFSINHEIKHTCYNILGIKFRTRCKKDFKLINKFFKHKVQENTILLVEANNCHYETLLGYYKYLKELNYNVEILTRGYTEKLLSKCDEEISIWECNSETFDYIFNNFNFSQYHCLFFNSKRIYWKNNNKKNDGSDIFDCYGKIPQGKLENIYVQHHIDFYNEDEKSKQIVLANPSKSESLENNIVNPHYFGDVSITGKNANKTVFITVGEINPARRNSDLLIKAVEYLNENKVSNFQIIVIGKGDLKNIPSKIRKYFKILGRVDFSTMYNAMEEADYFLPLLDPESELHQRYMKYGTSGSFQLIYGFLKPCIIHKTFADIYGFTEKDSILYDENLNLGNTMNKAICVTEKEYINLQKELSQNVKNIENFSIKNLGRLLNE